MTIQLKACEQLVYFQQHFYGILFNTFYLYYCQEDEVDGIDPIIRVWNLDKVFFIAAVYFLVDEFQCTCNLCVLIFILLLWR